MDSLSIEHDHPQLNIQREGLLPIWVEMVIVLLFIQNLIHEKKKQLNEKQI